MDQLPNWLIDPIIASLGRKQSSFLWPLSIFYARYPIQKEYHLANVVTATGAGPHTPCLYTDLCSCGGLRISQRGFKGNEIIYPSIYHTVVGALVYPILRSHITTSNGSFQWEHRVFNCHARINPIKSLLQVFGFRPLILRVAKPKSKKVASTT